MWQRYLFPLCFSLSSAHVLAASENFIVSRDAAAVMTQYCTACHGVKKQKGHVRLDTLSSMETGARQDLMNEMQEAIRFREMPPEDEKQPTEAERKLLDDWINSVLVAENAAKFADKLKKPEYGNYVDHEKLFSGEFKNLPGFTYDRRWLISEYIFNAKFQQLLGNTSTTKPKPNKNGKPQKNPVVGSRRFSNLSLANPFLLPEHSGVRYYADTDLTAGHLSSMLTNAQKVSEYITGYLVKRNKNYIPAINEIMALEDSHNATLATRRQFLEDYIPRLCEEYYGNKNETMLPKFVPVELKEVKELEKGEKYKKAPVHVALGMLGKLDGEKVVYSTLLAPENAKKSDEEIQALCERAWFYAGDHERTIQSRMALLRDYLPEFRKNAKDKAKKLKLIAYKPIGEKDMSAIQKAIVKHRQKGDHFNVVIDKCMADWTQEFQQERVKAGPPSDELFAKLVNQLFVQILERQPTSSEVSEFVALSQNYTTKLGNQKAIQKLIQTLILSSEFAYRQEFGTGKADQYGRKMLSPRDASYAIAYALTDQSPDAELVAAAESGKLNTREDYKREVTRILKRRDVDYIVDGILEDKNFKENTTNVAIRKLRFFREFFGYPTAITIFKDEKRFGGDRLSNATSRLLSEADRLVAYILEQDQKVFEELLTTEKFYVYHDGDNERMQVASDRIKSIYAYFKDLGWEKFEKEDLKKHADFLRKVKMRSVDPDNLEAKNRQGNTVQLFKKSMATITARLDKGQKEAAPFDLYRGYGNDFMPGYNVGKFFNFSLDNWDYKTQQPAKVEHRKGMLTHPIWLIAHAKNTETDPVVRGKWIREKLLAGTIPDAPITVDAMIPEDHNNTLRHRLASKTEDPYCYKCHQLMNPLGNTFEMYDDFGRFRTEEALEYPDQLIKEGPQKQKDFMIDIRDTYKTLPVDASGSLTGTGDKSLDGNVKDAIDLVGRLAKSERVRQSIIRHAFRYFMGRNETLSDSKTLMDADKAYVDSGGSFDAVIISLLTSDSFMYRKAIGETL